MTRFLAVLMAMFFAVTVAYAAAPAPPTDVVATDEPNDVGNQVQLTWKGSAGGAAGYMIFRKAVVGDQLSGASQLESVGETATGVTEPVNPEGPDGAVRIEDLSFADDEPIAAVSGGETSYLDETVEAGTSYMYAVQAVSATNEVSPLAITEKPVTPTWDWINESKLWFLFIMLTISLVVILFVMIAKSGRPVKVRKIAGLEAVNEAVGRATEMGRSCLFVPGILDINDIQTVAGLTVLSNVAKTAAKYDAKLEVPTARSLVMTAARETVQGSFLSAGRPDAYNEDDIYYLTDEQFGYTAGVQGKMVRDKPAACFYMGAFYAESLILAETGNAIGAIQVAGTAMPSQLPFFVAACDYTLIGEEFFAASAYLSGDPEQLGSLKGQDMGKVIAALLIVLGCLFSTLFVLTQSEKLGEISAYISENILGEEGLELNDSQRENIQAQMDQTKAVEARNKSMAELRQSILDRAAGADGT
ncbi:MAG: hypothetical protein MK116_01035 [Phycisphaerales bacterium]|nr:hypothetical protein [Phycisphaerales bacterium]